MTLIETQFELGQPVFLKTDPEQKKRIVKQICISPKGVEYNLAYNTESTWHFEFEVCEKEDVLVKCDVNKADKS